MHASSSVDRSLCTAHDSVEIPLQHQPTCPREAVEFIRDQRRAYRKLAPLVIEICAKRQWLLFSAVAWREHLFCPLTVAPLFQECTDSVRFHSCVALYKTYNQQVLGTEDTTSECSDDTDDVVDDLYIHPEPEHPGEATAGISVVLLDSINSDADLETLKDCINRANLASEDSYGQTLVSTSSMIEWVCRKRAYYQQLDERYHCTAWADDDEWWETPPTFRPARRDESNDGLIHGHALGRQPCMRQKMLWF